MRAGNIERPENFVREKGGLHDARINRVHFDTQARLLTLDLNDLDKNLEGLPEYRGARPCSLLLHNVKAFSLDVETGEGVRIGEARISGGQGEYLLEIDLNLGGGSRSEGYASIRAEFERLEIRVSP